MAACLAVAAPASAAATEAVSEAASSGVPSGYGDPGRYGYGAYTYGGGWPGAYIYAY